MSSLGDAAYPAGGGIRGAWVDGLVIGGRLGLGCESSGDRCCVGARGSGRGRAAGGVFAGELRGPRRGAWPEAPAAAARAGLSRSRCLHDRAGLGAGAVVEEEGSGRGRASTVWLRFAAEGPGWEDEINAELFESVLSCTGARGPARLGLAALAALADADGVVRGLSNDEICAAAGVEDRTYRRARPGCYRSRGRSSADTTNAAAALLAARPAPPSGHCGGGG